jgi:transcription-repair coupling factor (superfamily II helicase)
MYHRLGDATTPDEVDALFHELKDRFGTPPIPALWLYHMTRLRTFAALKRYSLLKFNTHTLETEQLSPRGPIKQTHPLKAQQSPAALEQAVQVILSQAAR